MIFKGKIVKILTQKDDDWGRYRVEDVSGAQKLAVGVIPGAVLDMYVELDGEDKTTKWGEQFQIDDVIDQKVPEGAGVKSFLCNFVTGIGPVKADRIVDLFGTECLKLFETAAGKKKLIESKCFSPVTIRPAVSSYEKYKEYIPLVLFFGGSATKDQLTKLKNKYGSIKNVEKKLNDDPYVICDEVKGFGFLKTDKLVLSRGKTKATSPSRVKSGMTYVLNQAASNDGDCFLYYDELKKRSLELLGRMPKLEDVTPIVAEHAAEIWEDGGKEKLIKNHNPLQETIDKIQETIETRKYLYDCFKEVFDEAIAEGRLINENGEIYTKAMRNNEEAVAANFGTMAEEAPTFAISRAKIDKAIAEVEKEKSEGEPEPFYFEEEQKQAVYNGLTHRISIMTGGPGTGKTTTIETIVRGFLLAGGKHSQVIMLAPTGRAAQRIKEQTGYEASTIHRQIYQYIDGEQILREETPSGCLFICDEFSMVDIRLARDLSRYVRDSNLVIVGDVDQIASVGPGKVLKDLISSEVIPTSFLKLGHRNVGSIAKNAHMINTGMFIKDYIYDEHFHYKGTKNKEDLPIMVINDYIRNVNKYGIREVMLATAMKDRGPCCVNKLNKELQSIFTGKNDRVVISGRTYALGDRVMQIKNDYKFVRVPAGDNKKPITGVFNGEKGIVVKVIHKDRTPFSEDRLIVKFDDGTFGGYSKDNIKNLVLAYATTVHKCQGSEAKCMMMTYSFSDYMLLKRSLFYTGETRAKEEFYFYGEEKPWGEHGSAFDVAVQKLEDKERNTGLKRRLRHSASKKASA